MVREVCFVFASQSYLTAAIPYTKMALLKSIKINHNCQVKSDTCYLTGASLKSNQRVTQINNNISYLFILSRHPSRAPLTSKIKGLREVSLDFFPSPFKLGCE